MVIRAENDFTSFPTQLVIIAALLRRLLTLASPSAQVAQLAQSPPQVTEGIYEVDAIGLANPFPQGILVTPAPE